MTNTNRFLNRLLVFVVGLVLLVAGGAVAAGALVPSVQKPVTQAAKDAKSPTADALSGGQAWILWVIAAAALVLIVLLLWFVFRQGHGRTSTLLRVETQPSSASAPGGTVIIDAKVAEQMLEDALADAPSVVAVDVTAFEVKKQSVLRITVQTRRGASPVETRSLVERAVSEWDTVLGTTTPVVVQIAAGLRAQTSTAARVA